MAIQEPRSGEKMTAADATAYVDHLYAQMYARWEPKVKQHPFMLQLHEGKLPMPVMRQFFKNWGRFALEVNALNALSYHTHLAFFVRNFDLLGPFCAKIADELISPKPLDQAPEFDQAEDQHKQHGSDHREFDQRRTASAAACLPFRTGRICCK